MQAMDAEQTAYVAAKKAGKVKKPRQSYELQSADPGEGPPIDLATLPLAMLHNREIVHAWAASRAFENWLRGRCAFHQIPMDSAWLAVEMLTVWVEAELVARATSPGDYVRLDEPDDEDEYPDEDTIDADRLSIVIPREPPTRYAPTLPGCQWQGGCVTLRAYGERFCPHHRREMRKIMRGG